jgi:hypothetical protein
VTSSGSVGIFGGNDDIYGTSLDHHLHICQLLALSESPDPYTPEHFLPTSDLVIQSELTCNNGQELAHPNLANRLKISNSWLTIDIPRLCL